MSVLSFCFQGEPPIPYPPIHHDVLLPPTLRIARALPVAGGDKFRQARIGAVEGRQDLWLV